jgi:hypothetical protein
VSVVFRVIWLALFAMESKIPEPVVSPKPSKWGSIAKKSVQKKNDRGDTIVIYLEGTSHERPLSDDDFIKISPHLKLVREASPLLTPLAPHSNVRFSLTSPPRPSPISCAGRPRCCRRRRRQGPARLPRRQGAVQRLRRRRRARPLRRAHRAARGRRGGRPRRPPVEKRPRRRGTGPKARVTPDGSNGAF